MTTFTARQMDHNNFMLFDGDVMVGLCDAQYVDLLMSAPALLAAAERILAWYPAEVIAQSSEHSDTGWQDLKALAAAVLKATGDTSGVRGAPGVDGQA